MLRISPNRFLIKAAMALATVLALAVPAAAQDVSPFENGWVLDPDASELRFMSIKKGSVVESSRFATLSGMIDESGQARIKVLMDSIDTKIDLRNVRMRFLFFETFQYPESTITAQISAADLADLPQVRQKFIALPYTLTVHGVTVGREDRVRVTLLSNDRVSVSSVEPIALPVSAFNLEEGRQKLMEAANVDILPFGTMSFDFVFNRARPGTPPPAETAQAVRPGSAALETAGNFDRDACIGRFEVLSRTGNIYFRSGSAHLQQKSMPLLRNLLDIVQRCPGMRIQVAGHTDSDGSQQANQRLSEARARAVARFLIDSGVEASRIETVGYGETRPAFPNDSARHKLWNRRIEFLVLN